MAVALKDLVGTHVVEAYWDGDRAHYDHPHCGPECEGEGGCLARYRPSRAGQWSNLLRVVLLRMDGITYKFEQEPVATSRPQDRSTLCGPITAMNLPAWPWDFQFDAAAGFPGGRVMEFRLHHTPDIEVVYATCETTGVGVFEIGTEFDHEPGAYESGEFDIMYFRWRFKPEGYMPAWLEPIDDGPKPVEIRGRREVWHKPSPGQKGDPRKLDSARRSERARRVRGAP